MQSINQSSPQAKQMAPTTPQTHLNSKHNQPFNGTDHA